MPSAPIDQSLSLGASGSSVIDVRGMQGYAFDLNMTSSDASGTLSIYCQNTPPTSDTFTRPPNFAYPITSGKFAGNLTGQQIDSAYLTAADYCVVAWNRSGGSGSVSIIGTKRAFF
jgi:hypothetical protein